MEPLLRKNYLRAVRVDRIAIVDRPAVPDAEILLFKRKSDVEIEKAKPERDILKAMTEEDMTAYSALDNEKKKIYMEARVEGKVHSEAMTMCEGKKEEEDSDKEESEEEKSKLKEIEKHSIIEPALVNTTDTGDRTLKGFIQSYIYRAVGSAVDALQDSIWGRVYGVGNGLLEVQANSEDLSTSFAEFRKVVSDLLARNLAEINKSAETISKLASDEVASNFTRGLVANVVSNSFPYFKSEITNLIVSSQNLESPETSIQGIINEFEKFITANINEIPQNKNDKSDDTLEKIGRKISNGRLTRLKSAVSLINEIVTEAEGHYLNLKSEEDAMELKALIEKMDKLSADVDSISNVLKEKKITLTPEETIEAEKKFKDTQEAELKAKADAEVVEKKAKEDAEARLVGIEKGLAEFNKFVETVSKRFGVKASKETDTPTPANDKSDVFGDALRSKK